jgi:hypothetical protein
LKVTDEPFSAPLLNLAAIQLPNGGRLFQGTYGGKRVAAALPIDRAARCIILLDWEAGEPNAFRNLFCIDRNGTIVWTAELPESYDRFTYIEMIGDRLWATSWSCFTVELDPMTGRVLSRTFTK